MKRKGIRAVFCVIMLVGCIAGTTYARAGGGSSSSGSSGGGSSGTYSSHSSSSLDSGTSRSNPIGGIFHIFFFVAALGGSTIVFIYKTKVSGFKSRREMKENVVYGTNWDRKEIQTRVEEAYFVIQECWRQEEPLYAAEYLSKECLEDFQMKIGWMQVRNEGVVQKNVRLLSATPVNVHDEEGEEKDYIWYLIHGSMVGYYINKDTGLHVRGNTRRESFYEYWKFVYRDGKWVLHEIKQKNEIDINQFVN